MLHTLLHTVSTLRNGEIKLQVSYASHTNLENTTSVLKSAQNIKHVWYPQTGWNQSVKLKFRVCANHTLWFSVKYIYYNYPKSADWFWLRATSVNSSRPQIMKCPSAFSKLSWRLNKGKTDFVVIQNSSSSCWSSYQDNICKLHLSNDISVNKTLTFKMHVNQISCVHWEGNRYDLYHTVIILTLSRQLFSELIMRQTCFPFTCQKTSVYMRWWWGGGSVHAWNCSIVDSSTCMI